MRLYESITSTTVKRRPVYFSYFATFLFRQHFSPNVSYTLISLCDGWWWYFVSWQNFPNSPPKESPVVRAKKTCVSTLISQFSDLNCCTTYTRPFLKEDEWCIAHLCDIIRIIRINHFQKHPTFFSFPINTMIFLFQWYPKHTTHCSLVHLIKRSILMATLAVSVSFGDILLYQVQGLNIFFLNVEKWHEFKTLNAMWCIQHMQNESRSLHKRLCRWLEMLNSLFWWHILHIINDNTISQNDWRSPT